MAATNYSRPVGDYRLVRVRGLKARIIDPSHLDRILAILEREGEDDLWKALADSQPFTTKAD